MSTLEPDFVSYHSGNWESRLLKQWMEERDLFQRVWALRIAIEFTTARNVFLPSHNEQWSLRAHLAWALEKIAVVEWLPRTAAVHYAPTVVLYDRAHVFTSAGDAERAIALDALSK